MKELGLPEKVRNLLKFTQLPRPELGPQPWLVNLKKTVCGLQQGVSVVPTPARKHSLNTLRNLTHQVPDRKVRISQEQTLSMFIPRVQLTAFRTIRCSHLQD